MVTFLTPLLARLDEEAPGIRLWVSPPGDDYVGRPPGAARWTWSSCPASLRTFREFPHRFLFQDRFVCAVDADNGHCGGQPVDTREFSSLPYLPPSCGHEALPLPKPSSTRSESLATPRSPLRFGLAPLLAPRHPQDRPDTIELAGLVPGRPDVAPAAGAADLPSSRSTS